MADRNFDQGHQSHQDWEKTNNRSNQDNDWFSQSGGNSGYSGQQQGNMNKRSKDVGYSGDSVRGMNMDNQGDYNRANYISDNDDNRSYGSRDNENTQFGSSGSQGYRSSAMDYNPGGYQSENRGSFGNAGNDYSSGDWNRRQHSGNSFGNQHGQDNDWNRKQSQQNSGSDYGRQNWGRNNMSGGYSNQRDYGNSNYGGSYGNMGNDIGRNDWDRNRNQYDRGYNQRRNDNGDNWWDKAKDKVNSWFNDDDNDNNRRDRNRDYSGGHRGKGPSDYRRSQDRIREDICDRLTDDDRVDASNIRVQIEDDAVILSGTVNSRDEKRRAEDLVESISGVRNVENRLRVGGGGLSSHDYTGNTDKLGGIGTESGTTQEIIRNVENERGSESQKGRPKTI